jgi:hypothetical protein
LKCGENVEDASAAFLKVVQRPEMTIGGSSDGPFDTKDVARLANRIDRPGKTGETSGERWKIVRLRQCLQRLARNEMCAQTTSARDECNFTRGHCQAF